MNHNTNNNNTSWCLPGGDCDQNTGLRTSHTLSRVSPTFVLGGRNSIPSYYKEMEILNLTWYVGCGMDLALFSPSYSNIAYWTASLSWADLNITFTISFNTQAIPWAFSSFPWSGLSFPHSSLFHSWSSSCILMSGSADPPCSSLPWNVMTLFVHLFFQMNCPT